MEVEVLHLNREHEGSPGPTVHIPNSTAPGTATTDLPGLERDVGGVGAVVGESKRLQQGTRRLMSLCPRELPQQLFEGALRCLFWCPLDGLREVEQDLPELAGEKEPLLGLHRKDLVEFV